VVQGPAASFPTVRLLRRKLLRFPGAGGPGSSHAGDSDSNSPAHWDGNTFYLLNSAVRSWRSSGPDVFHINAAPSLVAFDREINGGRWIESTWKSEDGTLYGWYHNEPFGGASEQWGPEAKHPLAAPRIGAARSRDNGATWEDLGIILSAPASSLRRDSHNRYFAGGNGDFSVIPDQERGYLYFLFSTYTGDLAEQGVSVARLRYTDRDHPAGRVRKWRAGRWSEPGLGGRVTPVFAAAGDWHGDHPDAFWGPSIHWNSYLLSRPFDAKELLARVRALPRRGKVHKARTIQIADLEIDTWDRRVQRGGREHSLTPREFALLQALAVSEGQTLSRDIIGRTCGGMPSAAPTP
jgi:hypothetical protein